MIVEVPMQEEIAETLIEEEVVTPPVQNVQAETLYAKDCTQFS